MKDTFATYHPAVNLLYFVLVTGIAIFVMHPAFLVASFASAFAYSVRLNGRKALKFNLIGMIPMMLTVAAVNPLFVHEGATILTYFSSGNPLTLESVYYGCASAMMLVSVIMWFSCYNAVMTSDKIIYLFGRVIPGMSLILSMVLRFVPRYKAQIKSISYAQRCIGRDAGSGSIVQRARSGLKIMAVMLMWALENGVETADSMQARGYGLKGRTSFSNYRFDSRDKIALSFILAVFAATAAGMAAGKAYVRFYPTFRMAGPDCLTAAVAFLYLLLCLIPVIIDIREDMRWKYLKSQI